MLTMKKIRKERAEFRKRESEAFNTMVEGVIMDRGKGKDKELEEQQKEISKNIFKAVADGLKEKGIKHDQSKPRYSLLPWSALEEVIKVLEHGAEKYSADNWKHVDNGIERYNDTALHHIIAKQTEELDPESGLSHAAHAVCCLLFEIYLRKEALTDEK